MRTKIWLAGFVALASIGIACGAGDSDTAGPGVQDTGSPAAAADAGAKEETKDGEKTIVLEVTGAKSADITYGLNADQSQELGAKVPWKKTLKSSEALVIPTIVAQNKGGGTINCKITMDGKVIKENASKGQYAVVTCSSS